MYMREAQNMKENLQKYVLTYPILQQFLQDPDKCAALLEGNLKVKAEAEAITNEIKETSLLQVQP